jgi:hypothetical protein
MQQFHAVRAPGAHVHCFAAQGRVHALPGNLFSRWLTRVCRIHPDLPVAPRAGPLAATVRSLSRIDMNFNALKVSTRLALGFGATVFLGFVIALFGTQRMDALAAKVDELATDRMPKMGAFAAIKDNFNVSARSVRNALLATDAAGREAEAKRIADMRAASDRLIAQLDASVTLPELRKQLKIIIDNNPA